jgi:thiamine biosynthesis lipoprotein
MVALIKPSLESDDAKHVINRADMKRENAGIWMKIPISDCALSVSALNGKTVQWNGKSYGHILDPHTGYPVSGAQMAAMATDSATESDALSTALLVAGEDGFDAIASLRPKSLAIACGVRQDSQEVWMKNTGIQADLSSLDFSESGKYPGS